MPSSRFGHIVLAGLILKQLSAGTQSTPIGLEKKSCPSAGAGTGFSQVEFTLARARVWGAKLSGQTSLGSTQRRPDLRISVMGRHHR
jgi:hypothetical protein